MTFLYNKFIRKFLLSLIVLWGVLSFWLINQANFTKIAITLIGAFSILFIFWEISSLFILIFSSFIISYSFYGLLFQLNLPVWLVMILILIIFSYLFIYNEQKIGILGNKRLVYLVLFSLIILEVFLVLNYFLISPISKSMIIATISYVFVGFCYTILAKHNDNKFINYLLIAGLLIFMIFSTSIWGV